MKQTFLVTGSNGLLGQKLTKQLVSDPEIDLVATGRGPDRNSLSKGYRYASMDITDKEMVRKVFVEFRPNVVIHTAAMTQVDDCEKQQELCELMNVRAVEYIASASEAIGAHLVHLSTDFIFDGSHGPLREEEEPAPLSIYGDSKKRSEEAVQELSSSWSILRTVLVYGLAEEMSRSNIVLWAKSSLEAGTPIRVVNDQFRTPTLAEDLAQACILAGKQKAQGVFHISGEELLSISEFVRRIAAFWDLDVSPMTEISTASLGQPARRPPKTGFIVEKAKKELGYSPRSIEEGLSLVHAQLNERNRRDQ